MSWGGFSDPNKRGRLSAPVHYATDRLLPVDVGVERRHTDGFERKAEENIAMIAAAGYDGVSAHWIDRERIRDLRGAHTAQVELEQIREE